MLTYRFSYAPHGPNDWVDVGISGGRRKALVYLHQHHPDRKGWKFVHSISPTGLIRT